MYNREEPHVRDGVPSTPIRGCSTPPLGAPRPRPALGLSLGSIRSDESDRPGPVFTLGKDTGSLASSLPGVPEGRAVEVEDDDDIEVIDLPADGHHALALSIPSTSEQPTPKRTLPGHLIQYEEPQQAGLIVPFSAQLPYGQAYSDAASQGAVAWQLQGQNQQLWDPAAAQAAYAWSQAAYWTAAGEAYSHSSAAAQYWGHVAAANAAYGVQVEPSADPVLAYDDPRQLLPANVAPDNYAKPVGASLAAGVRITVAALVILLLFVSLMYIMFINMVNP
eukprot:TRINITY_DN14605_c0_g1_i2.p1 TRINITY_DN14605_c0_g1~~TRINITY_DN14605_c0_g1_i2.p1  ORF type:complete len:278 (-),score=28.02 TRINITY_DN14605_c0_g1_i2:58-891(-)